MVYGIPRRPMFSAGGLCRRVDQQAWNMVHSGFQGVLRVFLRRPEIAFTVGYAGEQMVS